MDDGVRSDMPTSHNPDPLQSRGLSGWKGHFFQNFTIVRRAMLLTANNLCVSYVAKEILHSISLTLGNGQLVAILGPNGSGKSTLLKALLGLIPSAGSIAWNGKDLRQWSRRDLARTVAYLPQSPSFESGQNVSDVLRLGRAPYWKILGLESERDLAVVQSIAETLDLVSLLDNPIEELSGGQRQRVFIGRCLVQEPAALLLDEPDTFLDLKHQSTLYALLGKLAREKNVGILLASHDINLAAAHADQLLLLSEGAIAAAGNADEVLQPSIIEKVYGLPMERIDRAGIISMLPARI
jgi:iron complex transport system ATP-binding protein